MLVVYIHTYTQTSHTHAMKRKSLDASPCEFLQELQGNHYSKGKSQMDFILIIRSKNKFLTAHYWQKESVTHFRKNKGLGP